MTKRICSIDGCGKVHCAKGYCSAHYARNRLLGHPNSEKKLGAPNGAIIKWFDEIFNSLPWEKSDDCIIWPFGKTSGGYGYYASEKIGAHVYALSRHSGSSRPLNSHAAHDPKKCSSRACVNPNHLRWATAKENQADRVSAGTDSRGSKCVTSKLTEEQVLRIRKDDRRQIDIAKDYGIDQTNVSMIKRGKSWSWL